MAELGIIVTQTGAEQVKAELLSVGETGDVAAAKVAAAFKQTAQSVTQSAQQMNVSQRAAQQMGISLDQMAAAANGDAAAMRSLAQATNQATASQVELTVVQSEGAAVAEKTAAAQGLHGLQLGRLNQELGTFLGRLTGTNTAVTRLGAQIGGAVAGYGEMILLLGAIALVTAAYEKLTEGEKKAAEEQEHLNKVRQDYLDKVGRPSGEIGGVTTADAETAARLKVQIDTLTSQRDKLLTNVTPGSTALEQANALNNQIAELTKTYDAASNSAKVTGEETIRLTNASREAVAQATLEVDRQNALNSAFGTSALALAKLNADYKLRSDLIRDAAAYTGQEKVAMDALAQSQHDATVEAARLSTGVAELESKQAELNAALPGLQKGLDALGPSLLYVNNLWVDQQHAVQVLKDSYPGIAKDLNDIAAANKKIADAQLNQTADAIKKQQKYVDDMQKLWRDGIGKIATDGLKSWQDMFEDVFQLFTRLLDRMQAEGKAGGLAGQLLGLGASAVGGASIGYASGNIGTGFAGGAVAGFATAGPWGAVVGGLAGAAGGLFGASEKQKEAAAALMAAAQGAHRSESVYLAGGDPTASQIAQIKQEAADLINQLKNAQTATLQDLVDIQNERDRRLQQVSTDFWDGIAASMNALKGPAGAFANTLADLKKQYDANVQSATALGASTSDLSKVTDLYNAQVNDATAAYQHQIDQTRQGYQLRILNASGNSDAAFALQQQMELNDAFAQKLDQQTIVLLEQAQAAEKDRREREKQTQILQDQLSTQQQSLEQFKAVYDALGQFKNSLAIGQYSPLSPRAQLDAARGQLNSLYQSALGGNVNAGNQFSGVAQSFLDASRKYNASSAGYVVDYNSVNVMTDALRNAFGSRVSDAQRQIDLLQANLAALNAVKDGIVDLGTTLITVNAKLGAFYGEASDDQVAAAHDTTTAIVDVGRRLSASLDAIAQKVG